MLVVGKFIAFRTYSGNNSSVSPCLLSPLREFSYVRCGLAHGCRINEISENFAVSYMDFHFGEDLV